MVLEGTVPEERETLTEQIGTGLEEGGLGGAVAGGLRGAAEMFLPQSGLPGQRGLGDILNDFVEMSRVGDVLDLGAALDPNSGLDPLERLLAASPLIGVGAVGVHQGYRALSKRRLQAAPSMTPAPGQSYDLQTDYMSWGGTEAGPVQQRQQAAHIEQLALESQSEFSRGALKAQDWGELAAAVYPAGAGDPVLEGALRGIGSAVLATVRSDVVDLYGPDPDTAQFVAAQVAVTKWQRAKELGIIESDKHLLSDLKGAISEDTIMQIVQLETATAGIVGPDLVMPSPARIGQIIWTEAGEPRLVIGINGGVLPTERIMNWEAMYPYDPEAVRRRQGMIDYDSLVGLGGVNIAKLTLDAPPAGADYAGGLDAKERMNWYFRFNQVARQASEITGYSVHQAAGVLSALSANAPWIPTNLVGAVHVMLQTGRPDLVVGTPEYVDTFKQILSGTGWEWDFFDEAGALDDGGELQSQLQMPGAPGGIPDADRTFEHFADPLSIDSKGTLAMDADKREKVELILKGNLPPWLVLRGMKTNTFYRVGADPDIHDLLAVIDTWNDRGWHGTRWVGPARAHEGYTTKKQVDPNETYHDPVTGEDVSGAVVLERLETMRTEHGWTKKQVERWKGLLTSFPTRGQQARFLAQARSHIMVKEELGLESGHEVQAGSWGTVRRDWVGLTTKMIESAKDLDELRRIAEQGNLSTDWFTHAEGNPVMERTAAGMVWNVSPGLTGPSLTPDQITTSVKGSQRDASGRIDVPIVAEAGPDGTVVPYARSEVDGVRETLRHASPSGVVVNGYERYVANRPLPVLSVQDRLKAVSDLKREDGRVAAGFATVGFDPESSGHPALTPGDRVVVVLPQDRVREVESILRGTYPFDYRVGSVSTQATSAARNGVDIEGLGSMSDAQFGEVLLNNDWYAISAQTHGQTPGALWDATRRLKIALEKAGGTIVSSEGVYAGDSYQPVQSRNPDLESVANEYLRAAGMDLLGDRFERTQLDPRGGMERGDFFDGQPKLNLDPAVISSYDAFKRETLAQYQALVDAGYTFDWQDDYTEVDADEVHRRVIEDKHLPVFPDAPGFETDAEYREAKGSHPIFEDSPVMHNGRHVSYNELFRAVHDVFGHSMHEYDFSALGEENAWRSHAEMYSDEARAAMSYETRAQNSWQNFGPHLRDADGSPTYGTDKIDPNRPFPTQKAGILPAEMTVVDQPREPSFFVTGISAKDALRIAREFGQEAVASRIGMLNTDGTYHPPTGQPRFGDGVDPAGHTKLETGQRFSFDYDFEEAYPLPEDIDTLADASPQGKPMAQVTVEMGGEYGGANWKQVEDVLRGVGAVPGARVRLYTHSPTRVPPGYGRATESVFQDQAGVVGSIIHRGGDVYTRHHGDVWVPDWEFSTLSSDGWGADGSRRSDLDARSIMDIDEEAGMIWFDGEMAIQVPPDADVKLSGKGSVFRSLRVDGKLVRHLVVDTNGPVPILAVADESAVPGPGRVVSVLANGRVTKIIPYSDSDWIDARDALAGAGLIPDAESVTVEYPTQDETVKFTPTSTTDYDPYRIMVTGHKSLPINEMDGATTDRMRHAIPGLNRVILGNNATPELHRQLESVLHSLHGTTPADPGSVVWVSIDRLEGAENWTLERSHVGDESRAKVEELAAKMREMGPEAFWGAATDNMSDAITLTWRNTNAPQVIDGNHRLAAAKLAGHTRVPVRISQRMSGDTWLPAERDGQIREWLGVKGSSTLPGVEVVGPIPTSVWEGTYGINTEFIRDRDHVDAVTIMHTKGGITLNEGKVVSRWNRGARGPARSGHLVRTPTLTDFEHTIIHEMGHLLSRDLPVSLTNQMVTNAMDQIGSNSGVRLSLSGYALRDNKEFIAEAFLRVMVEGENAHPALIQLVRDLMGAQV